MKRHRVRKRTLLGGGVALLVGVLLVVTLMPDFGGNQARALAPADLNRIATRNDNAAMSAAAQMRERSAATARAADRRQDAADRGAAVEEPGANRTVPPPPPAR